MGVLPDVGPVLRRLLRCGQSLGCIVPRSRASSQSRPRRFRRRSAILAVKTVRRGQAKRADMANLRWTRRPPFHPGWRKTQSGSSSTIDQSLSQAASNPREFTQIRIIQPTPAHWAPAGENRAPWPVFQPANAVRRHAFVVLMKRRADTVRRPSCPEQELQTD